MDGVTFLKKIMQQHPIRLSFVQVLQATESETTMKVLEYGAVEVIQKPILEQKIF
jgi:two-component system chemotaxis response regulator CheB